MNTHVFSSSAAVHTGSSSGASKFHSLTWLPICTPARPSSLTHRRSSSAACVTNQPPTHVNMGEILVQMMGNVTI